MMIARGDLLRSTLKDTGNRVRTLAEDLEYSDLYLGIEKLRLGDHLNRSFTLPGAKDHPRTFTFNARSANLLNHTNVTAVNTILSSGAVGKLVAAETARRIELGVRFAF